MALGATTGGAVDIVAESELGAARGKTHRLALRAPPSPDDVRCTALAWSPSNDAHLAAAYSHPAAPCPVVLWDALAMSSSSRFALDFFHVSPPHQHTKSSSHFLHPLTEHHRNQ